MFYWIFIALVCVGTLVCAWGIMNEEKLIKIENRLFPKLKKWRESDDCGTSPEHSESND